MRRGDFVLKAFEIVTACDPARQAKRGGIADDRLAHLGWRFGVGVQSSQCLFGDCFGNTAVIRSGCVEDPRGFEQQSRIGSAQLPRIHDRLIPERTPSR